MKFEAQDFRYVVMPTRNVPVGIRPEYENAYQTWKGVWQQAYQEMGDQKKIFSDNFCRNTEVGVLFYGSRCAALTCFQRMNFGETPAREDSFFQYWSDQDIRSLCRDGNQILMCQGLTVAPEFRGEIAPGVRLKTLISGFSSLYLLKTGFDVIAGAMRKEKNMHTSVYAIGASLIGPSVGPYQWDLDLIGVFRQHLLQHPDKVSHPWLTAIWARHQDFTGFNDAPEKNQNEIQPRRQAA